MKILLKIWDHLEEFFLIPSLMLSTALIFIQVVMRYVFHNSLAWSEEAVRYLYVWQTWIGVSYAARNGSHLRITMVKDRLPAKGQKVLELFVTVLWIGFAVFVMIQGMAAVKTIAAFGQKSSALKIPMQICYLSIPVGMVLMSIRLIERACKDWFQSSKSTEGGAAE